MLTLQSLNLTTPKRKTHYQSTYLINSIQLSNKSITITNSELLYLKAVSLAISVQVLISSKDSPNHLKTFNLLLPTSEEFLMTSETFTAQSFQSSMVQL
jgi:hypothetical protein